MPAYERFRPKPYHSKISIFWWIKRKPYVLFIIRELTSIFVAIYAIILIIQIHAMAQGPDTWDALMISFSMPGSILLHVVILIFLLFHTFTWFKLAPKAMVLKIGKKRIPGSLIIAGNFIMWILLSAGIAWLVMSA